MILAGSAMRMPVLLAVLALAATGCAAPQPPKPAMAPLGVNGEFGYSERDLGPDKIEVTYRGAAVRVSSISPHDDAKSRMELEKAHDLALWRAAQIASERHKAGLKIDDESTSSDVETQHHTYYRPDPFYDPFFDPYDDPFWPPFRRPFGPDFGPMYRVEEVRTATSRAEVKLTVSLYDAYDGSGADMLSTDATAARLRAARGAEAY